MKVVIIGSSAAAVSCSDTLRKNDKEVQITIIGKENHKPYFRPQLSHMLGKNETEKGFFIKDEDYYEKNNIQLIRGEEIVEINPIEMKIISKSGKEFSYDKLVIAVGSKNFVPPVAGAELEGVFNLKFYDDLLKINKYLENKSKIVIIGGGLLGMEAAWSLKNSGKHVTVLEFADRLMARQLNPTASELVQKELAKEGINVFTSKSTKCIIGEGKVQKLLLESGEELDSDVVMFSIGIRPEVELAKNAKIEVNKGIVVNPQMRTSMDNIYAIGDCCEVHGMCPGIWPMAMQTGKIAALDILGKETTMEINPPSMILKALNIGVFSAGDITIVDDKIENFDGENYKLFTFKDGCLTGINLIGDTKLSGKAIKLLTEKASKEQIIEILK